MSGYRYLSAEEIIKINELVLREIKVRRADQIRLLSRAKLDDIITKARETKGDAYDVASSLLSGLIRGHPFASGNRRTAYLTAKLFLELNGEAMKVEHDAKVLQGIREGFYTIQEVKSWLKGSAIRRFTRG